MLICNWNELQRYPVTKCFTRGHKISISSKTKVPVLIAQQNVLKKYCSLIHLIFWY